MAETRGGKSDPKPPQWARGAWLRDDFLDAPIWFEAEEIAQGHYSFASIKNHHASLRLRVSQWCNGTIPTDIEDLARMAEMKAEEVPQLVTDLLRNGWVFVGCSKMVHTETDRRRKLMVQKIEAARSRRSIRDQSKRLRFRVLASCGFACRYCGRKAPQVELHIDHILPLSRGGEDVEQNMVAACAECNLGKNNTVVGGGNG
jgi:HNH endonuclease